MEALERSVAQLRGSLEAEKRSAAATQRRMVGENAELIRQLREAQQQLAEAQQEARSASACFSRASPSRASAKSGGGGGGGPTREGSEAGQSAAGSRPASCGRVPSARSGGQ